MSLSLDAIAGGASVAGLTRHELAALLAQCAAVQAHIAAALAQSDNTPVSTAPDRLLDAKEASAVLGVSPTWLYRRTRKLPFVVQLGGHVRFSERRLARFIGNHAGVE